MPTVAKPSLELAIRNISSHGDTDVFPFPLENHWFHDEPTVVLSILEEIDRDFDSMVSKYPVLFVKTLTGVGYSGFRAATQIDPIWNAYFLALVIEIARDIEAARIPVDRRVVFSYRLLLDPVKGTLFNPELGWTAFQKEALAKAAEAKYVLSTDISDFYSRIYHHRLENALQLASQNKEAVKRLKVLLFKFSSETSYGLPIGGNAARLLAEMLLNRADKLLTAHQVQFLRFVDDYYIFAASREEVQSALVFLSESLLIEGLSLSRAKTHLITKAEFLRSSPVAEAIVADSESESEARRFLRLRIAYDPYSPTADDDYNKLSAELDKFDIIAMLAREFRKSRIDEVLVRQLVRSVRFLALDARRGAIASILSNFEALYPVFPTVAILLKALLPDLEDATRAEIFGRLRHLLRTGSHIILVPTNLSFVLRLLAYDRDEETDGLLIKAYEGGNMMLKRDALLAMTRRRCEFWLSPALRSFATVTPWERRALLVASYTLADEGRHWRDGVRDQLESVSAKFLKWVGSKNDGQIWELPL